MPTGRPMAPLELSVDEVSQLQSLARACLQSCHGLDAGWSWCAVVSSPMRSGN
jgi:hypothetical protein